MIEFLTSVLEEYLPEQLEDWMQCQQPFRQDPEIQAPRQLLEPKWQRYGHGG